MRTNEVKEMITKTEDCVVFSLYLPVALFMSLSFLSFSLNLFSVWIFVKKMFWAGKCENNKQGLLMFNSAENYHDP